MTSFQVSSLEGIHGQLLAGPGSDLTVRDLEQRVAHVPETVLCPGLRAGRPGKGVLEDALNRVLTQKFGVPVRLLQEAHHISSVLPCHAFQEPIKLGQLRVLCRGSSQLQFDMSRIPDLLWQKQLLQGEDALPRCLRASQALAGLG